MKNIILAAAFAALIPATAMADVKVNFDPHLDVDEVVVQGILLSDMLSPRPGVRPDVYVDTLKVVSNKLELKLPKQGMAMYRVNIAPKQSLDFYALPTDMLTVDVTAPFSYSVSGTPLMEDITRLEKSFDPVNAEYQALVESGKVSRETILPLQQKYEAVALKFLEENPDSPAAVVAVTELEGDNCLQAFEKLSEKARQSPLYQMAVAQVSNVREQMAQEAKLKELANGTVDAPAFTLEGLDGKPVSLSDYKGKWVVIDFWGAWCKWCIKGFPELKKAYEKYGDKLVIIGVDNRDTVEQWKAAVKRFELPWVNVYNPASTAQALLDAYGVQGFPTKAIVNPQGKIVDITVGEDPSFFTRLDAFLK